MTILLDAKQTAELLHISYAYFRKLLSTSPESLPPFVQIGKVRRWRASDVDEWITANLGA